MDTFLISCSGSSTAVSTACPASCAAVVVRSSSRCVPARSMPNRAVSIAQRISFSSMVSALRLTARMAASFNSVSSLAPENSAVCLASASSDTSAASGFFRACTCNILSRSAIPGIGTSIWRSKRPARKRASSSVSARLVAASTTMPSFSPNPLISDSNAFSVCSRSSLLLSRFLPMASISSKKMTARPALRAFRNSVRIRAAPTPTYISTKSAPLTAKNGTPASPASARAISVLPVPGMP